MKRLCLVSTIVTLTFGWIFVSCCDAINKETYIAERKRVLKLEAAGRVGANIKLTEKEEVVNKILMKAKYSEIEAGEKSGYFPPAMHFFRAKHIIHTSVVFDIIKSMPKGGILHTHDPAMLDLNFMIKNMTYGQPNLFMCLNGRELFFKFAETKPTKPECEWKNVDEARKASKSAEIFDNELYLNMSLIVPDPEEYYPTQAAVWKRFYELFNAIDGLIYYKPMIKRLWYNALSLMLEDNIQYVEARSNLPPLYDLDGSTSSTDATVEAMKDAAEMFLRDHPEDFAGVKLIGSSRRAINTKDIRCKVKEAIHLRHKYPSFYAGFDLVGQEDAGHSLLYFIDDLLLPSQQSIDLPYFFHAGETDWNGLDVDDNLIDAVLLNTSRIGHGFAILKHPQVAKIAKNRGIAVELNPISNQVLKLVTDIRNHPGAPLIANDFPVVISSDDPALWGALPLSHDFYQAFMGLASADADLSLLKQLAINSIKYSAMGGEEKQRALLLWFRKWEIFLDRTISRFYKRRQENSTI